MVEVKVEFCFIFVRDIYFRGGYKKMLYEVIFKKLMNYIVISEDEKLFI